MKVTTEYIEQLINKYGDTALRVAFTYLKNRADAEDAVQDAFLRIIDKKPEFADDEHARLWIIKTTANICKNKLNLFWNRNRCSVDDIAEQGVYDTYGTDSSVTKAVMSLPQKYRAVIYLYYYEGYKTPEIAKITGSGEATARSPLRQDLQSAYRFRGLCTDLSHRGTSRSRSLNPR